MSVPLAIIAEITHRCPLHCVYCSNPLELSARARELTTEEWTRVFREAGELGSLHLHFTGGEPLARQDLTALVAAAHAAGLYTNLITSGVGLTERRLDELVAAGLEHVQLSFQDARPAQADTIAGAQAHAHKLQVARWIRKHPIAFTVNVVVHRQNLDRLDEIIRFAESLEPQRLEVANVQYYGWALKNREALLPTREQLDASLAVAEAATQRLQGKIRLEFVTPDYYSARPKACMGGWGRQLMLVDPAGNAMPCHAAGVIPGMVFENVRERALRWIWEESPSFNRFRGEAWMQEPCRSCERRAVDFGGCRCQALLLAGDAAATDPVCGLSPQRGLVDSILQAQVAAAQADATSAPPKSPGPAWMYRVNPGP